MARSLNVVMALVSGDSALYSSFHRQIRAGTRIPEDNKWDGGRAAIDETVFPNYAADIVFGALSLDGWGLTYYGAYVIVLRDEVVEDRATVFEENSFRFVQRWRIVAGNPVPPGHRAVWAARDKLAVAKLHSKLDRGTRPEDFPGILLSAGTGPSDGDFIEVHIFGSIHRRAVERVIGPPPKRAERSLHRSLERKLREVGAHLETR